jgi:hypothetical protein
LASIPFEIYSGRVYTDSAASCIFLPLTGHNNERPEKSGIAISSINLVKLEVFQCRKQKESMKRTG